MNNVIRSFGSWTNKQKILMGFVVKPSGWGQQHLDYSNQFNLYIQNYKLHR